MLALGGVGGEACLNIGVEVAPVLAELVADCTFAVWFQVVFGTFPLLDRGRF